MTQDEFEKVFDQVVGQCREVLVNKAREYSSDGDRMHNFKVAGAFKGESPELALWGMATKHLVSISDMVRSNTVYSAEMWDEKIGDALNYLILLRALLVEEEPQNQSNDEGPHPTDPLPFTNFTALPRLDDKEN